MARPPEMYWSGRKRNGPLPTTSDTALNGSVAARRSGMITGGLGCDLPSAQAREANGFFRRNTSVSSAGVSIASSRAARVWPSESRFVHRAIEAAQSTARTGAPSWKRRPGRSVTVQRRPSSSTRCPAAICGCGWSCSSTPYSVSYTR